MIFANGFRALLCTLPKELASASSARKSKFIKGYFSTILSKKKTILNHLIVNKEWGNKKVYLSSDFMFKARNHKR